MDYPKYFYPKNSLNLYGFKKEFNFLTSLYSSNKLPKVLMLTGSRGSGKSTLINHFLFSIFDKNNYDKNSSNLSSSSVLYKQFIKNIFQNIIFLEGADFKSIKIEDIRNLKSKIQQSSIMNKDRFIILNDVELFNINSLNALLKIIEEPNKTDHFILINNKSKPLIDTIKSRSLEYKIILSENKKKEIIDKLVKLHNIQTFLDPKYSRLTPGNFLKYNYIFNEHNISVDNKFQENLTLLIDLYKKYKDILYFDIIFYLLDFYFINLKNKNIFNNERIFETKSFILENLNKYLTFNLSENLLINAINNKLNNE